MDDDCANLDERSSLDVPRGLPSAPPSDSMPASPAKKSSQRSPEEAGTAAQAKAKSFGARRRSSLLGGASSRHCRFEVTTSKLGSGAYGCVMLGVDVTTGQSVAIKFIADGRMKTTSLDREVDILRRLSKREHPSICRMHAYLRPTEVSSGDIRSEGGGSLPKALRGCHALVMDAARGGELFEYVVSQNGLSEPESGPLFVQLIAAVRRAHELGIAHRDLKLENVLLHGRQDETEPLQMSLIDWGLAYQHALSDDGTPVAETLHSRCGSRSYMAPEVTNKEISSTKGYNGFQADVWSLGVCLFAIHLGFFPFEQANVDHDWRARKVAAAQLKGESTMKTILDFYSQRDTELSEALLALLDRMLVFNPKKRATLSEVAESDWVKRWTASSSLSNEPSLTSLASTVSLTRAFSSTETLAHLPSESLDRIGRPIVERQDSNSTIHSTSSHASSHTSSHTSSFSAAQSIRDSIRAPARLRITEVEEESESVSHWNAVRYAIAGARQQTRQAQQQRRSSNNDPKLGRSQSFARALRSFGRKSSNGAISSRCSPTIAPEAVEA